MPKILVNGKEIEANGQDKLIKVLIDNKVFVPHYCWHPGLPPHGNCRMCLVKVSNSRKLEVACMYPVTDKLEVTTEGPEVDAARKQVQEFLLINHPLDCPICDKAGECDLQDYTYKYRGGLSRFEEDKNIRHTKDLGPNIRIWGNRCIVCTRCVRFTEEISGGGELCVVNRGDRSVVDVFPGVPIDNPLSLNVVDLCPVGALIDKNFMYSARVWFTKKQDTLCASCARGCNVEATVLENEIKRLTPRPNPDVNQYWMCDEGRLNIGYVAGPRRLSRSAGGAREIGEAGKTFKFAIVVSTYSTVEELWLVKKLADALRAVSVGFLTLSRGQRQVFKSGFAIEADKTPNRAYAESLFGAEAVAAGWEPAARDVLEGRADALLVINGIPDVPPPPDLVRAAEKASFSAVADIQNTPIAAFANVVIPSAAWAEKDGTFMNVDGRLQRIKKAVEPPPSARADVDWIQEALVALGERGRALSPESVFKEAFPELDYGKVGLQGVNVNAPVAH